MTLSLIDTNPAAETFTDGEGAAAPANPKPKLILPFGRGRTGKSFFTRWLIDRARSRGQEIAAADADTVNPSISPYFSDAMVPPSDEDDDVQAWFETLCEQLACSTSNLTADLGGVARLLHRIAKGIGPLAPALVRCGIEPVAVHLIGPEPGDLAALRSLETGSLYAPEATILILNMGCLPWSGQSETAFRPVLEHPVFKAALDRGAKPVWMPQLIIEPETTQRRLTFSAAASGLPPDGRAPLTIFSQHIATSWLAAMEHNFAPVMDWLS